MATQITVTGTFVDADGAIRAGSVEARPTDAFRCTADGISVNRAWADLGDLDGDGGISALMYATTDATISPAGVEYDFRITFDDGTVETFRCSVPHDASGGTYNLNTRPSRGEGSPAVDYATMADVNGAVARGLDRSALQASRVQVFSHSYGKLGVDDEWQVFHERLAGRLHADLEVNSISGSSICESGVYSGGWNHIMRSCPHPWTNYNEDQYRAQRGAAVLVQGVNDLNNTDYNAAAEFPTCLYDTFRAVISWLSLGAAFNFRQSAGMTFPAGSWSQTENSSTAAGRVPEWGYKYSGSTGAQVQVVVDEAGAGGTAALFFVANKNGGLITCGPITFTLDGVATDPIGYESVTFQTDDRWPAAVAGSGIMVARFALPDDGAQHTIVATAGAGGMAFWGYGIEKSRPLAVCNIARPLDAGYTAPADDDLVVTVNEQIAAIVEEFGSPITLVDMDGIMGKSADAFDDNVHPNPEYQARLADAVFEALVDATTSAERKYL